MIELRNLTKTFYQSGRQTNVVDRVNAVFPTGSAVALLGRNGAGKSTLLKIISGALEPTVGEIISDGTISWPVGLSGTFHPDLNATQNVRFVARVYGVDSDDLIDLVRDFSELGDKFDVPIRSYSSGMRARLAFAVSMGIRFDTYLIDEVTSVGDQSFRDKCTTMLQDRLSNSSAVMVSHNVSTVRAICDRGAVLENGRLTWYDDLEAAIEHHLANMKK
ncbi:MAG: ABC transporter ATP-binding protein [Rhodobacteraceae bacterium]|nr:ABC transporter ATP-binding protein [Paracoccaceae bacterium]